MWMIKDRKVLVCRNIKKGLAGFDDIYNNKEEQRININTYQKGALVNFLFEKWRRHNPAWLGPIG